MKATIKYKKWWWKFIPSKRKELRIMQAILDHITEKPEFQKEVNRRVMDSLIYGKDPR